MKVNSVGTGIKLIGTTIKSMTIQNTIVNNDKDVERTFGMYINEPEFERQPALFAQMTIDFEIKLRQMDKQECEIHLSLEGAFLSDENVNEDMFKELVMLNGAAALIGIARGKIEAMSASVFNEGKIVIPFVNVVDYYKDLK